MKITLWYYIVKKKQKYTKERKLNKRVTLYATQKAEKGIDLREFRAASSDHRAEGTGP